MPEESKYGTNLSHSIRFLISHSHFDTPTLYIIWCSLRAERKGCLDDDDSQISQLAFYSNNQINANRFQINKYSSKVAGRQQMSKKQFTKPSFYIFKSIETHYSLMLAVILVHLTVV